MSTAITCIGTDNYRQNLRVSVSTSADSIYGYWNRQLPRISLGLMINVGMLLASSRRLILNEFVRCQVRANETYSEAKRQFSDRNRDVLMSVQSPHKWWSTLTSAVFGSSSSLPPLVSDGGGLVCESVGKADLLSDHFDSEESREAVDLPLTCNRSSNFTTFAFRWSEVRRLLLDLRQ